MELKLKLKRKIIEFGNYYHSHKANAHCHFLLSKHKETNMTKVGNMTNKTIKLLLHACG